MNMTSPDALFTAADAAFCKAKREGRGYAQNSPEKPARLFAPTMRLVTRPNRKEP